MRITFEFDLFDILLLGLTAAAIDAAADALEPRRYGMNVHLGEKSMNPNLLAALAFTLAAGAAYPVSVTPTFNGSPDTAAKVNSLAVTGVDALQKTDGTWEIDLSTAVNGDSIAISVTAGITFGDGTVRTLVQQGTITVAGGNDPYGMTVSIGAPAAG